MTYGKIWPAHPKPCHDELLSSWIVRVAQANGIKLQTLCWQLFGNAVSPWNRDIDRTAPSWLLSAFSKHTGQPYWDLFHTTLATYRTRLYQHRRLSGQLAWVLPVNNHGMNRQSYGQQFCPKCLSEGPFPYFRKHWRIALFTYCPIHQIALHDACPNCYAPIVHYRGDFGKNLEDATPMNECHLCGFDLSEAQSFPINFPNDELRSEFNQMLQSVLEPANPIEKFDLSYFRVMHQLCRIMGANNSAGRLSNYLSTQLNLKSFCSLPTTIESLRLEQRHEFLLATLWLMTDLQNRLNLAWRAKSVRYNSLTKDFKNKPRWFIDVVRTFSNWRSL